MKTQLLCTFAQRADINIVIEYIKQNFAIPERRVFIFENARDTNKLYCTYNIESNTTRGVNTISIHRKKESNTLYTVNALNELIQAVNNGVLDKTYQVDWNNYKNSLLLTSDITGYQIIPLTIYSKINW